MSDSSRDDSAASSPPPSGWIEVPELFEPADPETTALFEAIRASGIEFRTKKTIVGISHYGHVTKLSLLFRSHDAQRAALTLYKILFESEETEGPTSRCEACGEQLGSEARCPSCGLNRALDITEDPLAIWIAECLGKN